MMEEGKSWYESIGTRSGRDDFRVVGTTGIEVEDMAADGEGAVAKMDDKLIQYFYLRSTMGALMSSAKQDKKAKVKTTG